MAVTNGYVTAAQLKATLSITGTTFDADVDAVINAASRMIDGETGRRFWLDANASQTQVYTPNSYRRLMIDDLVTLTTLSVDHDGDGVYEETWTQGTDFVLEPFNAPSESPARPYESILARRHGSRYFPYYSPASYVEAAVQVIGRFGWSTVPPDIALATSILAAKLFKRSREAPFGIVGFHADSSVAMRISAKDPDVHNLLQGYIRHTPFI